MTRTYVVTGAGSGIGLATTELLRECGFKVVGVDLKGADVRADLSNHAGRMQAAAQVLDATGGVVDAVVACAGVSAPKAFTVSVNYFGVTELVEALVPALARSDAPRVAVVSSIASLQPNSPQLVDALLADDEALALELGRALQAQGPDVGYMNYASSKRAVSRWVRRVCVTDRYAGNGIAINAVAPAAVITAMTRELLATEAGRAQVDAAAPMPLNHHAEAIVIARLLVWLTSPENTHVTGQTIYIDGGTDAVTRGDDIWSAFDARPQPPSRPG